MPHAARTVTIAAPVEQVFAFFTDPADETAWRFAVKEMHADGEPAVGRVVRQTVVGPGKQVQKSVDGEMAALDTAKRLLEA